MRVTLPELMKICRDCGIEKDVEDFYVANPQTGTRRPECKMCQGDALKIREERKREADPIGYAAHRDAIVHRSWLKNKYGLTPGEYEVLLVQQDSACAICKTDDPGRTGSQRFAVDHDHETGVVRGLLCDACNVGLGRFRDDPMLLQAATQYVAERVMTYSGQ